ncbi:rho GTPase-activating protein 45-like isoform X2 [Lineus longissimus]|uniref:rho GTPase-activating protein 45-like isoform X2 n=1 Tax=Lineus longissimus TaxID=88925 RepID=UPI00315C91C9
MSTQKSLGMGLRTTIHLAMSAVASADVPKGSDSVFCDLPLTRRVSTGAMSPARSKSGSWGSISSDTMDVPMVDQEDIFSLTHDVRNFSLSLTKLRSVFADVPEYGDAMRVSAHNQLGEVVSTLKTILQKYQALHSTEMYAASGTLICTIKSFNYEDEDADPNIIYDGIDQLALAFSSSVSEYLMGDVESNYTNRTRSFESLSSLPVNGSIQDSESKDSGSFTSEDVDHTLMKLEDGVEVALDRAKAWSKYVKDIITYVEKRAMLEAEFSKSLAKLANNTKSGLMADSFLPFQSVYCTAMGQDTDYANTSIATCNLIQTQKFIEPLNHRRAEHDKARKSIRDAWNKENRKMHDAVNNLRKAKQLYVTRQQEYENARDAVLKVEQEGQGQTGAKLEKKKKQEEDTMHRAAEAETTYKACVVEANSRQSELEKVKGSLLAQIRELIYLCDEAMKTVTVGYFQLQHTVTSPIPVQFQTLGESCQVYEPGAQFAEYVRRQQSSGMRENAEPFIFEPYYAEKDDVRKPSHSSDSPSDLTNESPRLGKDNVRQPSYGAAWRQRHLPIISGNSDTESASGGSSKSRESSPSASPHNLLRHKIGLAVDEYGEELSSSTHSDACQVDGGGPFKNIQQSHAAQTHTFRKLRTPSKCRECDSYVYFNGAECNKCGMAIHKKCLEVCSMTCGKKPPQRRLTTFGIDFKEQVEERHIDIPPILVKCVAEVEKRGITQKGLYRVSGVKSRVEKLCQSFEIEGDKVDLTEHHPNVIANVLKLYLRQLPEPLLTFPLYSEFVRAAREDTPPNREATINRLSYLVKLLPRPNFKSLGLLMHHLHKVTKLEDLNQMNASNLGIVFGPTLLRPREGGASLNSLMDTPHQTRAVELMVLYAEKIFGSATDFQKKESENLVTPEAPRSRVLSVGAEGHERQRNTSTSRDQPSNVLTMDEQTHQNTHGELSVGLPGSTQSQKSKDSVGVTLHGSATFVDEDDLDVVDNLLPDWSPAQHNSLAKTISLPVSGADVSSIKDTELSLEGDVPTRRLLSSKSLPYKSPTPPYSTHEAKSPGANIKPSHSLRTSASQSPAKMHTSPSSAKQPASVPLTSLSPSGSQTSSQMNTSSSSPHHERRTDLASFNPGDPREPKFV